MKKEVTKELKKITAAECQQALTKLPTHWHKCVKSEGEYFEGRGLLPDYDPYFNGVEDDWENDSENPEEADSDSD